MSVRLNGDHENGYPTRSALDRNMTDFMLQLHRYLDHILVYRMT